MTLRSRLAVAGIASAVVLSVAACSSSATQSPSAAASTAASPAASTTASVALPSAVASALASTGNVTDASTVFTADMAASVIGGSPTKVAPPINVPNVSMVSYGTTTGDSVTVFIEAVPGGAANAGLQAAIAMAGAQGQLQTVSGLGDSAGKVIDANEATVAFVKGSSLVVIGAQSSSTSGSDLDPKVQAVAQQIAGKL